MSALNVQLVIVDPQVDFCDPKGALFVPGADKDMERLAGLVERLAPKLDDVHVTMDSHRIVDISHPVWWKRVGDGKHPAPFTILGLDQGGRVVALDGATLAPTREEYATARPSFLQRSKDYLKALTAGKRYPHVIWPPHCLIGTPGHNVHPALVPALRRWEEQNFAMVDYVTKGSNPFTEHFSGVKAEVPDPMDPSTQLNTGLIRTLEEADVVVVAGEALSHCVANTVRDIASCFSDARYIGKLVLLRDATSNVGGFEAFGEVFLKEMAAKGMNTDTCAGFMR